MNKVSLLKMAKVVPTKLELSKAIIYLTLCFNGVKLSDTEVTVLAYFMVYGVSQKTKNLLVGSEVCKNINNIKTVMVKLKRLELIYKDDLNGKVLVTKALTLDLTPTVCLYLKIDTKA